MHKKLVRYDGLHFLEVDPVCLRRTAAVLQQQINLKVPVDQDMFEFHKVTLPVVQAALKGEIKRSLENRLDRFVSGNYKHEKMEGTLPANYDREFQTAVAEFTVVAEGRPLEQVEIVVIDGEHYGWVEMEDEGDWPDKVKYK